MISEIEQQFGVDVTDIVNGKLNDKGLSFPDIVAAACFNFGTIITLDKSGCLHGDMSGIDMDDFMKDFEW